MKSRTILLIILIASIFSGCGKPRPEGTISLTPETTITSLPLATNTVPPTATPPLPSVFVVIPDGTNQPIVDQALPVIKELADQSGMELKTVSMIAPADLEHQDVRLVIVFPPLSNLTEIALAVASTQILAISFPQADPTNNVSQIQIDEGHFDIKSFLAGYISAVVTTDWRIGLITQFGDENGNAVQVTFSNGASYFCGLCLSVYPPYPIPSYPLYYEYSGAAGDLDALIAYFQEWQVQTVYLSPPLDQADDLLMALDKAGFHLIAERLLPEGLQANWVASIVTADLSQAISDLWPKLMGGEGGKQVNLSLVVVPGNPELFSPGRQSLVNQVLGDLMMGYIDTGFDTTTLEQP